MIWVAAALAAPVEVAVRDRANGDPIPGARVSVGDQHVTTDGFGLATLDLADGSWSIDVAATDWAPATVAITMPVDRARVWLSPRPGGYEVVIEGFRPSPHTTRRTLDAEQSYETPGVYEDAARLVQALPGVAVQREFGPSGGDLWVRGAAPRESRVYLDGVEVPYLYHYNQYASVFPASQIDALELFPSTFGPAYGDAVGAIVEARSPVEAPETVHGSAHGSFVMAGADARVPFHGGWASVAARRSYFDVAGEQSAQYPRWPRFWDGSARVEVGRTGFFLWGAGDGYTRAAGELDALDPVEGAASPTLDYARGFEIGGVRHHWDGGRVVAAVVHAAQTADLSRGGREDLDDLTATSRLDARGTGWEAGWEIRAGRTALVVAPDPSGILVAEEAPNLAVGAPANDALLRARAAAYAGLVWRTGPLRWMPGLRVGVDSTGGGVLSEPRLALRWQPDDATAFAIGGGRYLQRPQSALLIVTPGLPTTASWQLSAGVERSIAGRLEVGLDGWWKRLDDPLVVPVDALPYAADLGDGRGIELTARYRLRERFFVWGFLALTRSRLRLGERVWPSDGDQPVSVGLVASLDQGPWNVGLRWRYGSGLPWTPVEGSVYDAGEDAWAPIAGDDNSSRYPAYQKLDARVARAWAFRGWALTASLEIWFVPRSSAQLFPVWSYDYREQGWVIGPTVLPLASLRATF